jgi:cytoskeletal protein RodZ
MTDFGERLRKERESRNITLRDLSEATKINKRYLEALEQNDFDSIPGGVFIRGYIRSYAESIGINPAPLLDEYLRIRSAGGDGEEEEQAAKEAAQAALSTLAAKLDESRSGIRSFSRIALIGLIGVVLIAIAAWSYLRFFGEEPVEPTVAAPPVQEEVQPAVAEPPEEIAPAEPEPVVVEEPAAAAPAEPEPVVVEEPPAAAPVEEEPAPVVEEPVIEVAVVSDLTISEFGVGTGVANRQLVGESDSFREGETVWFWNRVIGGSAGDTVEHVWIREGVRQGSIALNIGGSHWRTQSRWSMRQGAAGTWTVEARDSEGRLLATSEFTCLPAD